MTWARLDDDILMHPKWWSLSAQAFQLGIRLVVWANKYSIESGIVPWGVIREMAGGSTRRARRLIAELVDAGKPIKENGILEPLEGGSWKIHNFERYRAPQRQQTQTTNAERSDAARRAGQASADARRARNGSAQPRKSEHSSSGLYPVVVERTSNGSRTNPRTDVERLSNEPSNGFSNGRRTPVPDPGEEILPAAAAQDLTGSAREKRPSVAAAAAPAAPEKVSCPTDLALSAEHRTRLAADGVPDYAMAAGTTRFVGKSRSDLNDLRTLTAWRKSLFAAVHGMWLDPKQRPKSPDSFDKPGPAKTKASDDYVIMPDGTRVRA